MSAVHLTALSAGLHCDLHTRFFKEFCSLWWILSYPLKQASDTSLIYRTGHRRRSRWNNPAASSQQRTARRCAAISGVIRQQRDAESAGDKKERESELSQWNSSSLWREWKGKQSSLPKAAMVMKRTQWDQLNMFPWVNWEQLVSRQQSEDK